MFDDKESTLKFIDAEKQRLDENHSSAWNLRNDIFYFGESEKQVDVLPFVPIIKRQLEYTHELQRIA